MLLKNKITGSIAEFAISQGDDWQELTQSEIDAYELEQAKKEKIAQCLSFLSNNDWQATKFIETGEPISQELLDKKALARSLQNDIKDCTTLEELNLINTDF